MQSRIIPAIAKLFDAPNWRGTKKDVAEAVHCDIKTAARVLMDLHVNRNLYVVGWVRQRGGPVAIYALRTAGQQDAQKIEPKAKLPFAERNDLTSVYAQRKARARLNKVLSGEIRLGVWGL